MADKHYENFSHKILDSRVPLCYAISEGRPRLCNTSSKAGALPSELRIENDSDRKFYKSTFFKVFLTTTFVHVSCWEPTGLVFWLPDREQPEIDLISGWPDFAGPETGVFDRKFCRKFWFFSKADYLFDGEFLSERIYFLLDTENAIK